MNVSDVFLNDVNDVINLMNFKNVIFINEGQLYFYLLFRHGSDHECIDFKWIKVRYSSWTNSSFTISYH